MLCLISGSEYQHVSKTYPMNRWRYLTRCLCQKHAIMNQFNTYKIRNKGLLVNINQASIMIKYK